MTPQSKRAKIFMAEDDLWNFRSFDMEVRVDPSNLGDEPISETTAFGERNTLLFFYANVGGKRKRIACDGGDEPSGWVKRTGLTETHVAGAFQVDMIRCRDFYSSEELTLDVLPIRIDGTFSIERKGFP